MKGMLKFGLVALIVLTLFIVGIKGGTYRECVNCGENCKPGSCDDSTACSQCIIYDCVYNGGPQNLYCNLAQN